MQIVKAKPLPYQREGVRIIEKCDGNTLLADEMGLGKTLQALWALERNADRWLPALVVCPASVKHGWEFEAQHHVNLRADICTGRKPPRMSKVGVEQSPLTIINFDILQGWLSHLQTLPFRSLIVDECQNLQNAKTVRTRMVRALARQTQRVLGISGTPIRNCPRDLFPILNIIWPNEFPSFWQYAQAYCKPTLKPWGWDFSGATNIPELHRRLSKLGVVRRMEQDVESQIPPLSRRIVPVPLSDPTEYAEAAENFLQYLQRKNPGKLRTARKAEALVRVGYLLRLAARLKLKGCVDRVNRFLRETDEKIVLFATHTKAIDVMQKRIEFPSITITGSVSAKERALRIRQFQGDPKIRVAICNTKSAGVGITLTAARTAGIVEFPWCPADIDQAEKRIHRIGQTRKVNILYFIGQNTYEETLCAVLQQKRRVSLETMDGVESSKNSINLHEELLKSIEGRLV